MQLPILTLLLAGVVYSTQPISTKTAYRYLFETDTVQPVNVGINTRYPEQPLHVIGNSLFENKDSNSVFANISLRKSYNGRLGIGAGKMIGAYSFQDGKASISGITTATETAGIPNVAITFHTTNNAGVFEERFRITEEGILNYARDMRALYTERSLVDKAYVDAI